MLNVSIVALRTDVLVGLLITIDGVYDYYRQVALSDGHDGSPLVGRWSEWLPPRVRNPLPTEIAKGALRMIAARTLRSLDWY